MAASYTAAPPAPLPLQAKRACYTRACADDNAAVLTDVPEELIRAIQSSRKG